MSQRPTPADQDALAAKAKAHFIENFEGAKVELLTSFFHPPVVRAFKRTFYTATRNWWLTVTLAGKLKDEVLRVRVQEAMLSKVVETLNKAKKAEQQLDALMINAELTPDAITRGKPHTEKVTLYGPVSAKFREVMLVCDRLLDKATLLYTMGEMPQQGFDDVQRDVKNYLKGVDASLRNHRITVMSKLNAEGGARAGYQGKKAEGEAAAGASAEAEAAAAADVPVPAEPAAPAELRAAQG